MKETEKEQNLCPNVVPVIKGLEPQIPLCRETGQSIKAIYKSPTGFQKSSGCRMGGLADAYCKLTVAKEQLDELKELPPHLKG
ncbi:MAG: hypothetical protein ABSC49_02985 [Candidatus Microgenomates bacterium]